MSKQLFIGFYVEKDGDWSFTLYNFHNLLFCNEFPRKQCLFSTTSIMSQLLTEDWWRFYWNEVNKTFIRILYCKIRFWKFEFYLLSIILILQTYYLIISLVSQCNSICNRSISDSVLVIINAKQSIMLNIINQMHETTNHLY